MNVHPRIDSAAIKAGPIRNGFNSNVTTLIYKKSAAVRLISHLSFIQIFDTMLMPEGRELTFLNSRLHRSPAIHLWPCQTTMSNVKALPG